MKTYFKIIALALQIIFFVGCKSNAQTKTISVDEFEKGIANSNIQLLDVRTSQEYNAGHLANALQANWNNDAEFAERTKALDKAQPIYIYCLSGGRSNAAMEWLFKNGYKQIYNMQGGINAWKQANKSVAGLANVPQTSLQDFLNTIPKDKSVLVDVGAKWCPPCKKMQPILDSLKNEKYNIIAVDGGEQTELCKQLNITAFPVFIVYKNGVEVTRKQGLLTSAELKKLLND